MTDTTKPTPNAQGEADKLARELEAEGTSFEYCVINSAGEAILARALAAARAEGEQAERERCAKLAESYACKWDNPSGLERYKAVSEVAAAIRKGA